MANGSAKLFRGELPQHKRQNAAVAVVLHFLRRVNPELGGELLCRPIRRLRADSYGRAAILKGLLNSRDMIALLSRQTKRLPSLAGRKLERQHTHAH